MASQFYPGGAPSPPPEPPAPSGKATASLVLGICSLFLWLCPIVGLAATIVGLVLGVQANGVRRTGTATAGVVLCILGLVASVVNGAVGAYLGATGEHGLLNALQGQ